MGAGKSTVGRVLSASVGYNFLDLDDFIEKEYGEKITDIFLHKGEDYFRDLETDSLTKVSEDKSDTVISTGGGIVLKPSNVSIIKSTGTSIYLKASIDTIWERIKNQSGRPLLEVENPYEKASELLESREMLYQDSDYVIDTDGLTPKLISDRISELIFA